MVKSEMMANIQDRINRLPPLFCVTAFIFGSLISTGCVPKSNTQQVKSNYAKIWNDRATRYQQEIRTLTENRKRELSLSNDLSAKTKQSSGPENHISFVTKKGALEVLTAFNEFRKGEPGLDVVEAWMRKRKAVYVNRLPKEIEELKKLLELVSDKSDPTKNLVKFKDYQIEEVGFALGALWELERISAQISEFSSRYKTAVRKDPGFGKENPLGPISNSNAAVMGALIGAGAVRF